MSDLYKDLVDAACAARNNSHSPYSNFRVGAALLAISGEVYPGTNVENASIGLSICAERSAVCAAVARGETAFTAIAVCADGTDRKPPCGASRQFRLEFGRVLKMLLSGENGSSGEVRDYAMSYLLQHAFETYVESETRASGG